MPRFCQNLLKTAPARYPGRRVRLYVGGVLRHCSCLGCAGVHVVAAVIQGCGRRFLALLLLIDPFCDLSIQRPVIRRKLSVYRPNSMRRFRVLTLMAPCWLPRGGTGMVIGIQRHGGSLWGLQNPRLPGLAKGELTVSVKLSRSLDLSLAVPSLTPLQLPAFSGRRPYNAVPA